MPEITYYDLSFAGVLVADLLILTFAYHARCWLLLAGIIFTVPYKILRAVHFLERANGIAQRPFSELRILINCSLYLCSVVLIAAGMIQILYRYAKMKRVLAQQGSQ